MKTAVSKIGQNVLPAEIHRQGGIKPRQELLAQPRDYGLLSWLLTCPEKGFFVSIESESTDEAIRERLGVQRGEGATKYPRTTTK